MTETKVSARCCSLFEKVAETREGGNVITATPFNNLNTLFRDLTKERISHSYSKSVWTSSADDFYSKNIAAKLQISIIFRVVNESGQAEHIRV